MFSEKYFTRNCSPRKVFIEVGCKFIKTSLFNEFDGAVLNRNVRQLVEHIVRCKAKIRWQLIKSFQLLQGLLYIISMFCLYGNDNQVRKPTLRHSANNKNGYINILSHRRKCLSNIVIQSC